MSPESIELQAPPQPHNRSVRIEKVDLTAVLLERQDIHRNAADIQRDRDATSACAYDVAVGNSVIRFRADQHRRRECIRVDDDLRGDRAVH